MNNHQINNDKYKFTMKKILMAAVALICMTMTSMVFTSCGDEKVEIKPINEHVYYQLKDLDNVLYYKAYKAQAAAFINELAAVISSATEQQDITSEQIIIRIQNVVDQYNNKAIYGTFKLQESNNGSTWKTIKTYTMTADPSLENEED